MEWEKKKDLKYSHDLGDTFILDEKLYLLGGY